MDVSSRSRAVLAVGLALAVVVFYGNAHLTWDSVVDDAYISARYAEHFAQGHGLVYNAGEPPVEGYTNLLWTLLLGWGRWIGLPILGLMTGLGFLFGVVGIGFTVALAKQLGARDDRPADALVLVGLAFVLALSPHLAVSSTNGIESSMMFAVTAGTLWAHLAFPQGPRRWIAGALGGALVLTRPEGLAVAGLVALHDLWLHRRDLRGALPFTGLVAATTVGLFAWRLATYGLLLPNTWYAKSSFPILNENWELETLRVNKNYLRENQSALLGLAALGAVAAVVPPWRAGKWVVFAVGLFLGLVPLTVNLWMPGLRLFLAPGALAAALVAAALLRGPVGLGRALALASVLGMGVYQYVSGDRIRSYDWRHTVLPGNGTELAAKHIAAHAPPGAWLATRDAGCLAYWVGTGVKVAELHPRALTQRHVDGADFDPRDLTPINPEFVVPTVQREHADRIAYRQDRQIFERLTMPYAYPGRVYQHYHRYYDVYVRGDVAMPPFPAKIIVNRAGVKPAREVELGGAVATAAEPLPDTGL